MTDSSSPDGNPKWPWRYVAHATIEFRTPFAIRSGRGDVFSDSLFVVDANGLPAIPGSSIAGVLRHNAARFGFSPAEINDLFGHEIEKGQDIGNGARLTVSWACVHDRHDKPVEGLADPYGDQADDPVLENARQGVLRDHVRLGHRGSAENRGKFEETLVAAGHRFTFELHLVGKAEDEAGWNRLLGLLSWRGLRLGGGSRRGFGAFTLIRLHQCGFDLAKKKDFGAYCDVGGFDLGGIKSSDQPTSDQPRVKSEPAGAVIIILNGFGPREPWLFGGGVAESGEDFAPVAEKRVTWRKDNRDGGLLGAVNAAPVHMIPATGLKGSLSHRLAWHHNLLTARDRWRTAPPEESDPPPNDAKSAIEALFGRVKESGTGVQGRIGRLVLDDLFLSEVLAATACGMSPRTASPVERAGAACSPKRCFGPARGRRAIA
jgi:CRISPR/Cas system CSM-associated protein Csm3 (group 7 of RAMP superfamily)